MLVLLAGFPISGGDFWSLLEWLLGYRSPPLVRVWTVSQPAKNPGGFKHLPFNNYNILALICASTQNIIVEVYTELLGLHGLVYALTCSVNCGTLFTQVCTFLNYVSLIQFATGRLQSGFWFLLNLHVLLKLPNPNHPPPISHRASLQQPPSHHHPPPTPQQHHPPAIHYLPNPHHPSSPHHPPSTHHPAVLYGSTDLHKMAVRVYSFMAFTGSEWNVFPVSLCDI